jgi:hypothetical protein
MDGLIDTQHGPVVLLASLLIMFCIHIVISVGKLLFEIFKKKEEKSDRNLNEVSLALQQNTNAVRELRIQLGILEREISEIQKYKLNVNRLFAAVKIMAGPKWQDIKKEIVDDDIK